MGERYSVHLNRVAVTTTGTVLFNFQPTANVRMRLLEFRIGHTIAADAARRFVVKLLRADSAFATEGGNALTPAKLHPWARAAVTRAIRTPTAATDGASVVAAWAYTGSNGFEYKADDDEEDAFWVEKSSNLGIQLTATDGATFSATAIFEEMAKPPS
jgi:hypothetical protein